MDPIVYHILGAKIYIPTIYNIIIISIDRLVEVNPKILIKSIRPKNFFVVSRITLEICY